MSQLTQQAERCFSCRQDLDPDEPHWATHADYYQMRVGVQTVADLPCLGGERIASYCPICIPSFQLDHFVFDRPVPKSKPRKLLSECSFCDGESVEGEFFFVVHVAEYKYAADAQHLLAHSVAHVVICPRCDGPIDPLSAILERKRGTNPLDELPAPGI
jgi:hypothetical protein